VGDWAEIEKCFGATEVATFTDLSEDRNPVHLDSDYAASTRFGRPIVHGMLSSSLFSGLLGTKLPGKGSIYMSQSLSFKAPIYVGERVRARIEVTSLHQTKPVVTFKTECFNESGQLCITGEAVVYVPHHAGQTRKEKTNPISEEAK
jgi:enoyl-CoA hydratase